MLIFQTHLRRCIAWNKIIITVTVLKSLVWIASSHLFDLIRTNQDFLDCSCGKFKPEKNYIDGTLITSAQFPWLVGILKESGPLSTPGSPMCYGTLISNKHILTAASCVQKKNPYSIAAYFYGDFSSKTRRRRTIRSISVHNGYSNKNHDNNLAILTLAAPIDLENVRGKNEIYPICIPNPFLFSARLNKLKGIMTKMELYNTAFIPESPPYYFGSVEAKILGIRNPKCSNLFSQRPKQNILCQKLNGNCYGDEGSPLTIMLSETGRPIQSGGRYYALGIYSKGYGCDGFQSGKTGVDVSTNLMNHTDWLIRKTRDGQFCS